MDVYLFYKERYWVQNYVVFKWQIQDLNVSFFVIDFSFFSIVFYIILIFCDYIYFVGQMGI